MPCYDSRDDFDKANVKRVMDNLERHNSLLAQMLCSTLRTMTAEQIGKLPKEVQVWWREHKQRDKARGRK